MMLFLAEDDLVIKDQIHLENGLAVVIAVCLPLHQPYGYPGNL